MKEVFVLRYGEIALKLGNRKHFENKLIENINQKISVVTSKKVTHEDRRMYIEDDDYRLFDILSKIPWLVNFSLAKKVDLDIESIKYAVDELIVEEDSFSSFKVETHRSNKGFSMNTLEINRYIWNYIWEKTEKVVDFKNPEISFKIEIHNKFAFVYTRKHKWVGGLPVGVSWKVISLISWWIDSPVASYMMMRRWCEVIFVHAFNKTMNPEKVREKVYKLVEKLSEYQIKTKLYLLPYWDFQKEVVENVPPKRRMLLFKRSIIRVSNKIAEYEKAKAITVWDALSQVASQTLDNLNVTNYASEIPLISPLIWFDKLDIINSSKNIWTYETSVEPHDDCCSLIAAKNPETKWRPYLADKYERRLDIHELENNILEETIIKEF